MAQCILTVEDSTSLRELIAFTLQEEGYEVIEAADGREALKRLEKNRVQLVITDLNMPNMNGIELTIKLRSDPVHKFIPIVFLTTESQALKKQAAREAGATGWIVKPFKQEQLIQVVRKMLG